MLNEIPDGDPRGDGGGGRPTVVGGVVKKIKDNKKLVWRIFLAAIVILAIYALAA